MEDFKYNANCKRQKAARQRKIGGHPPLNIQHRPPVMVVLILEEVLF